MAEFDVYEQIKAKRKALKRARAFIGKYEWIEQVIDNLETLSVYVDCSMTSDSFLGLGVCMAWRGKIQTMSTLEEYCDTTTNGELRAVLYGVQSVLGLLQVAIQPKQVIIYSDLRDIEKILSGEVLSDHVYIQDTLREIHSTYKEFCLKFPNIVLEVEYLTPEQQRDNLLYGGAHHCARTVTRVPEFEKMHL